MICAKLDKLSGLMVAYGLMEVALQDQSYSYVRIPDDFKPEVGFQYRWNGSNFIAEPIQMVQPKAPEDYSALRNRVATIAGSAVGTTVDQLTASQRLSLLVCLLYNAGALDPATLAVKPLNQWVHDPA